MFVHEKQQNSIENTEQDGGDVVGIFESVVDGICSTSDELSGGDKRDALREWISKVQEEETPRVRSAENNPQKIVDEVDAVAVGKE